jgi:hypothetical protein
MSNPTLYKYLSLALPKLVGQLSHQAIALAWRYWFGIIRHWFNIVLIHADGSVYCCGMLPPLLNLTDRPMKQLIVVNKILVVI